MARRPARRRTVPTGSGGDDPQSQFISVVLGDMEDTWTEVFAKAGERYQPPVLVLFNETVQSACGSASAATGPFYCPGGQQGLSRSVVLPRAGSELRRARRLRAGLRRRARGRPSRAERAGRERAGLAPAATGVEGRRQQLSVRLELQADCYAGVWGHYAARQDMLEPGRRGRRPAGRGGDRRRPPAAPEPGPRRARELHPRLVGAARRVAAPRLSATGASKSAIPSTRGMPTSHDARPSTRSSRRCSGARYILSLSFTSKVA